MRFRCLFARHFCTLLQVGLLLSFNVPLYAQETDARALELTASERAWLAAHPVIRIGVDSGYAPYAFFDEDGQFRGVAADFMAHIGSMLGVRTEVVSGLSWPQILTAVESRRLDLVTTAVKLPEREAYMNFSRIYIPTPLVIMTRDDAPRLASIDQLLQLRVALVEDYSSSRQVMDRYPALKPVFVADPLAGLYAVSGGEADAYVGVLGVGTHLASLHGISNLKVNVAFDMAGNGQRYGVRKDWPELVTLLDKALKAIPDDEKHAIFHKWLPVQGEPVRTLGPGLTPHQRRWLAAHPRLRVGIETDRVPLSFVDENGRHAGISADILNLLGPRMGVVFDYVRGASQARLLEMAREGEVDLVAAVRGIAGGVPGIALTQPYHHAYLMVFAPSDTRYRGNVNELNDKTVAVRLGSAAQDYLPTHSRIRLLTLNTVAAALQAVADGRADVAVLGAGPALEELGRRGYGEVRASAPLVGGDVPLSFSVRADQPELLGILNQLLLEITPQEKALILQKWLSLPPVEFDRARWLRWVLAIGLLLLLAYLAVLLWNRRLRHQVVRHRRVEADLVQALQASEAHLRGLVNTIPDLVWLKDPQGIYLACNPGFERMFGAREAEILGKTDFDFVDAELATHFRNKDAQAIAAGRPCTNEEWVTFAVDGCRKLLETVKTPMYGADGDLIGVLGVARDITERKQSEQRLRQSAAVFENTAEGVFITDTDGNVIDVNRAFTNITGYTLDDVRGRNPRMWRSQRHDRDFYQAMWLSLHEDGEWRGEIWNRRKDGGLYPARLTISRVPDEHGHPINFVAVFADITHVKQSAAMLERLAHHDPLTELPNRLLFNARLRHALEHARRNEQHLAVLFIDLDRFKNINDSFGHLVGDALLKSVARRLRGCIRLEDTVARIGGDEFILLLEGMEDPASSAVIAEKLLADFARPFDLDGREVYITPSIGISLYPRDGEDCEALLRNADTAMYRAKKQGRNAYAFYTEQMTALAVERVMLENSLRRALERNELQLYYQPQVRLESGALIGAEALLRWIHPDMGVISPARFIPLAEESGLILPIGEWVLQTACAQAQAWLDGGLEFGVMAVNIAGPQIQRGNLVAVTRRVLEQTGLPPSRLELEVTESFIMEEAEAAIGILDGLRALGVSIAIDDFGTGYSSLAYLKRLPIDRLKIDQSFVHDIPADQNDMAITRAVIALGLSMQMQVIAEGVENEAQRQFLLSEGCALGQGYLFGRPVPADEFRIWAQNQSPA